MDITKLSLTELKALGYDLVNEVDRLKSNLNMVNIQINKRLEEKKTDQNNDKPVE